MLCASDACSSSAIENDPDLADIFADDFQGVQQRRSRDDCSSVLIVVEYGNLHCPLECFFDVETFWCFDVLKIDAAERGFQQLANLDDFIRVMSIKFNVEDIDVSESFE